jgi:hypothetical protein
MAVIRRYGWQLAFWAFWLVSLFSLLTPDLGRRGILAWIVGTVAFSVIIRLGASILDPFPISFPVLAGVLAGLVWWAVASPKTPPWATATMGGLLGLAVFIFLLSGTGTSEPSQPQS